MEISVLRICTSADVPINWLHNLVHVAFGSGGFAPTARAVVIGYGILTIVALIPVLNTTFGLIPAAPEAVPPPVQWQD